MRCGIPILAIVLLCGCAHTELTLYPNGRCEIQHTTVARVADAKCDATDEVAMIEHKEISKGFSSILLSAVTGFFTGGVAFPF